MSLLAYFSPPRAASVGAAVLVLGAALAACSGPEATRPSAARESKAETRVYHVHLELTRDKRRATSLQTKGRQWWTEQPSSEMPPLLEGAPSELPVTIEWKAPYYRVQLGPFATQEQAERALDAAESTFPDAFVAPERAPPPS